MDWQFPSSRLHEPGIPHHARPHACLLWVHKRGTLFFHSRTRPSEQRISEGREQRPPGAARQHGTNGRLEIVGIHDPVRSDGCVPKPESAGNGSRAETCMYR